VGFLRASSAVVLMERSARVSESSLRLKRPTSGYPTAPDGWPCALLPAGPHPRRKSPCGRSYVAFPLLVIPARPRRYAVDGRWPCTPNPGRWTNQRTAPPTGFPATLTRRRWRLTLPDAHRAIPPPARVPPIGSSGDDMEMCGWLPLRLLGELTSIAAPPRVAPR
jgi:hypothetical protein